MIAMYLLLSAVLAMLATVAALSLRGLNDVPLVVRLLRQVHALRSRNAVLVQDVAALAAEVDRLRRVLWWRTPGRAAGRRAG